MPARRSSKVPPRTPSPAADDPDRPLLESDLLDDPIAQFQRWFDDSLGLDLVEPNAVVLATASAAGAPTARVVLLKGVDDDGFLFFTNYQSRKGRELLENPRAALCFHWVDLGRQVRVEGTVKKAPRRVNEAYFRTRPRASQLSAWASPQSDVVVDRAFLEAHMQEMVARFEGREVPCPSHWGGYLLKAAQIEFWRNGPARLHDRFLYRRARRGWIRERLAP